MIRAGGHRPVVVDTGVFAAGLTARSMSLAERYRPLLVGHELVITVQTVSELYLGAAKDHWGTERLRQLDQHIGLAVVAPCDNHLARVCAEFRLLCLHGGHPLAQKIHGNDLWVAAVAIRYAIPLVSDDGIFVGAPGLQLSTTGA